MQQEILRHITANSGNVVVAHGVENDLKQVGLTGVKYAQTDAFGEVKDHKALADAKRHMELAVSWYQLYFSNLKSKIPNIRRLIVKTNWLTKNLTKNNRDLSQKNWNLLIIIINSS